MRGQTLCNAAPTSASETQDFFNSAVRDLQLEIIETQ